MKTAIKTVLIVLLVMFIGSVAASSHSQYQNVTPVSSGWNSTYNYTYNSVYGSAYSCDPYQTGHYLSNPYRPYYEFYYSPYYSNNRHLGGYYGAMWIDYRDFYGLR